MALREDIVYRYDGSADGMLTCIFEAFARREAPAAILSPDEPQGSLFETRIVPTDFQKAERVLAGLRKTAGSEAYLCLPGGGGGGLALQYGPCHL